MAGESTGLQQGVFARNAAQVLLAFGATVLILMYCLGSDVKHCTGERAYRKMPWTAGEPATNRTAQLSPHVVWERQALSNLSSYKSTLLNRMVSLWRKKEFWSVHQPIVTCPPGRPLTRYGGKGDGSKLLCGLTARLQREDCVIYSLGSNGASISSGCYLLSKLQQGAIIGVYSQHLHRKSGLRGR